MGISILQRFRDDVRSSPRGRMSDIARETGITLKTLSNILLGKVTNPQINNVDPLREFYAREDRKRRRAA